VRNSIIFSILITLVFMACEPRPVSSPAPLPTQYYVEKNTQVPTLTLLPTGTHVATKTTIPTATFIPKSTLEPTLSREQYPPLSTVALDYDDFSESDESYFANYFWGESHLSLEKRAIVTVKDITKDSTAKKNGSCDFDCSVHLWTSSDQLSATITLILTKSPESAQLLSEKLCRGIAKEINLKIDKYKDCQSESNLFGLPLPTVDSWVLGLSYHEKFFGGTYGDVFISIRLYQLRSGDDGGVNVQILFDMAKPQVDKLKQAGFPANP
jgi:hypothetical protein